MNDIARLRAASHQLCGTAIDSPVKMVEWFGAVQAQEYALSKWGLGLRLQGIADADVERELSCGSILRTHILRPTWHFVSARDIRWMLMLSAPRVRAANSYMERKTGLDEKLLVRTGDLIARSLQGGRQLTREEINEELLRNGIEASGHRLSYIMMRAELDGIVCSGARRGNSFTYALLDERVPASPVMTREEALGELSLRYFSSRGPATAKDFSVWSGLTLADCRKGAAMLAGRTEILRTEGEEYYFIPYDRRDNSSGVFLLPPYDEYVMGYKDRSAMFPVADGYANMYDSIILRGGMAVGSWRRQVSSKKIILEYDFYDPPGDALMSGFEAAAVRFSGFTGLPVSSR